MSLIIIIPYAPVLNDPYAILLQEVRLACPKCNHQTCQLIIIEREIVTFLGLMRQSMFESHYVCMGCGKAVKRRRWHKEAKLLAKEKRRECRMSLSFRKRHSALIWLIATFIIAILGFVVILYFD